MGNINDLPRLAPARGSSSLNGERILEPPKVGERLRKIGHHENAPVWHVLAIVDQRPGFWVAVLKVWFWRRQRWHYECETVYSFEAGSFYRLPRRKRSQSTKAD